MTTEIVRATDGANLTQKMDYARALASASLLPTSYRGNPGNVLLAIEFGDALGVPPIQAINGIHVIEGKPSASADLIASLVRRAGHKLRISGDDRAAIAELIRADDPEFTYRAEWTLDKARAAGLTNKGVWKAYPGAMLRARAITEVARMGASDALYGVIYTPEELDAPVGPSGEPVTVTAQVREERPRSGSARLADAVASHPAAAEAQPEPETPGITEPQRRKIGALMKEAGLTERSAALAFVAEVTGRRVQSRNELTRDEAGKVIDWLERDLERPDAAADVVDAEVIEPDPADDAWLAGAPTEEAGR